MPTAKVDGVNIVYEIVGTSGPVVAVMPGARRGYAEMKPLAEKIAAGGYRVFLHDRRNTGGSDMKLDDGDTEEGTWADELHALLKQLNLLPAYVCGSSSGARTALNFALRHPEALRGLLLIRVTGGAFAAERLPQNYYRVFIEAAEKGGMAAVSETDRFREYISTNPAVRDQLMAMDPKRFIEIQSNLLDKFLAGARLPVMGMTEAELNSIKVPTIIVPGNDNTHSSKSGRIAHEMIKGSEIHQLPITDQDVDLISWPDWSHLEPEIAAAFIDFMGRSEKAAAA
jgi:pimeloyl-ACP methyl ester carboxylesterase